MFEHGALQQYPNIQNIVSINLISFFHFCCKNLLKTEGRLDIESSVRSLLMKGIWMWRVEKR